MYRVDLHHFFLLWHVSNQLGHILQRHLVSVSSLGFILTNNASNLLIDCLIGFDTMGVSESGPNLILIIEVSDLVVVEFERAVVSQAFLIVSNITLVIIVVTGRCK